MVEYAVHNHADTSAVRLLNEMREIGVGGFQIHRICRALPVALRVPVICLRWIEQPPLILRNHGQMRIDVVVILRVILVIRRRYEQRIKIQRLHAE